MDGIDSVVGREAPVPGEDAATKFGFGLAYSGDPHLNGSGALKKEIILQRLPVDYSLGRKVCGSKVG